MHSPSMILRDNSLFLRAAGAVATRTAVTSAGRAAGASAGRAATVTHDVGCLADVVCVIGDVGLVENRWWCECC